MSELSYEQKLARLAKGVETFSYLPRSDGMLAPDEHNMRMRLQYPDWDFSDIPHIRLIQEDIIDGLQAFISINNPEGFRKFSVSRNAQLFLKDRVGSQRGFIKRFGSIDPEDYSRFNLNSEDGQQALLRDTRIFFDRIDPVHPVMVALWAQAWAKKIICDSRRRKSALNALRASTGDSSGVDVHVVEYNGREQIPLKIGDIFKLSSMDTTHMVDLNTANCSILSQCGSFQYWAQNEPDALCDALLRFASLSLGMTVGNYNKLLGVEPPKYPSNPNDFVRHFTLQDITDFIYDPITPRYTREETDKNNPVSVYTLAAFFPCPALLPYSKGMHPGTTEADFIKRPIAFSYFNYTNFDADSLYDLVSLDDAFASKPRASWRAERHEYAKKNYIGSTERMALDYLFVKQACYGNCDNAVYLGAANKFGNPQRLLKYSLGICEGLLQEMLDRANGLGVSLGDIPPPRDTPYPSVALEETVRQFHLHDPTILNFSKDANMSEIDRQRYLFLTQPSVLSLADGLITRNKDIKAQLDKSLDEFLPVFLYEVQKSLYFMPKELSQCVLERDYVYVTPCKSRKLQDEYTDSFIQPSTPSIDI